MLTEQQEQLCKMGDEAEFLIGSEAFTHVVNQLVEQSFQQFVNSSAEQTEVRERSYHHYRALVDIVDTLRQRVSVRDEINTKLAEDNNSQEEA